MKVAEDETADIVTAVEVEAAVELTERPMEDTMSPENGEMKRL